MFSNGEAYMVDVLDYFRILIANNPRTHWNLYQIREYNTETTFDKEAYYLRRIMSWIRQLFNFELY